MRGVHNCAGELREPLPCGLIPAVYTRCCIRILRGLFKVEQKLDISLGSRYRRMIDGEHRKARVQREKRGLVQHLEMR